MVANPLNSGPDNFEWILRVALEDFSENMRETGEDYQQQGRTDEAAKCFADSDAAETLIGRVVVRETDEIERLRALIQEIADIRGANTDDVAGQLSRILHRENYRDDWIWRCRDVGYPSRLCCPECHGTATYSKCTGPQDGLCCCAARKVASKL